MIRAIRRWTAKRALARMCRQNMARLHSGPARDRFGRFTRKTA
ncbi:hypothetical protein [Sphingobium chungbukense]|nr:hypothetical protein [Sphingobium chungbukense]